MIRTYLLALLAFAIGIGAVAIFAADSGYVLISFRHWIVETSLFTALVAIAVFGLVWRFSVLLTGVAIRLPERLRTTLNRRRVERARLTFELGLQGLYEGDWQQAESDLVRRAADHHAVHLNYLAAARAAYRAQAPERAEHYLMLAVRNRPSVESSALLLRGESLLQRDELPAARAAAEKLRELKPKLGAAVDLLAEVLARSHDWEALRALLDNSRGLAAPTPSRRAELEVAAVRAQLSAAQLDGGLDRLKAVWAGAGAARDDRCVRRDYLRGLARVNADNDAGAQIVSAVDREWDGDLVRLYGELHVADPVAHLANVERWLSVYGEKPVLLLTAARACRLARLWGKARSYLDAALRLAPSTAIYLELARLAEDTRESAEAARFYREGLVWSVDGDKGPAAD